MALLHRLLLQAARRAAADPRVQAKAAELYQTKLKPRAQAAWREAKPKLDAAKQEIKEIARESDPRREPKAFAARLKARFIDRDQDD